MWLVTRLPHPFRIRFGALLGWLGYRLAKHRRHIVEINLALCFPGMAPAERQDLVRRVFRSSGISLVETALAWLRPRETFADLARVNGLEHLERAVAEGKGKGVILLGMHLTTLDFAGAVLSKYIDLDVMYRPNKNKVVELLMKRGRERNFRSAIHRDDIRGVIRNLKAGHIVWYGPDQDYGRRHSVFAPFFGVETATITATARIARISGAPVIVLTHYRDPDDEHYEINLSPPLENFPEGDDIRDARRINELVEKAVEKRPDQYWWLHRRFKTRPPGEERPY